MTRSVFHRWGLLLAAVLTLLLLCACGADSPDMPDGTTQPNQAATEEPSTSQPEQETQSPPESEPATEPPTETEAPQAQVIAPAVDLSALYHTPENGVQDIRRWSEGNARFTEKPLAMDGYTIYRVKTDRDLLESYIDMLCENGFTLAATYDRSSYIGTYIEYALLRSGSSLPTRNDIYTKTPCHINIWRENGRYWRLEVVDGLEFCDMGLRKSGNISTVGPRGDSAQAGLLFLSDTYTTDDGRLSATTAQSTVLSDGQAMAATPALEKDSSGQYTLTLSGFGSDTLTIIWEADAIRQGEVYLYSDIEQNDISVRFDINDEPYQAYLLAAVKLDNLTLRVMHYDEDGAAVFYLYAEGFDIGTREILCAVDLSAAAGASTSDGASGSSTPSSSGTYTPSYAKPDCLTCHGSGNCQTCGGYGEVRRYQGQGQTVRAKCSACYGSGKCRTCNGTGKRD